ncbi:hypothetical protein [Kitasatospora kifunensis]|uniref:Uncharacterized protein n=1 Tax=Kitasatospora kifunensis TaxID=58351 RepID=A0A7W7QY60_KITKI|nr:hypothetical protein [Kitasatospora kifunensis]MBB4921947.1 hypothetical protein [Kitasatospora kifunensis]
MSTLPAGKFTIVNTETGRCVRVRLGRTTDVTDSRASIENLLPVTTEPAVELGAADGSPATAWWASSLNSSVEGQSVNRIVSHAVGEYQSIGDYGVWMYAGSSAEHRKKRAALAAFENRLNELPADVKAKLAALIPDAWKAWEAKRYSAELKKWQLDNEETEEKRCEIVAWREAFAADEEPPSADNLARYIAIKERDLAVELARQRWEEFQDAHEKYKERVESTYLNDPGSTQPEWDLGAEVQLVPLPEPTPEEKALTAEMQQNPRYTRVDERVDDLLPAMAERRTKDLERDWQLRAPAAELEQWHKLCAALALDKSDISFPGASEDQKKTFNAALRAYLEAAAKQGVKPTTDSSGAPTGMDAGGTPDDGDTYRWVYDGTHIYAAAGRTVPSERTYWTDEDGRLVGKSKGGPGQTWTLASWTPPAPTSDPGRPILLTGLFGPVGVAVGNTVGL